MTSAPVVGSEGRYLADIADRQRRNWPADVPTEVTYPFGERPLTEYLHRRATEHGDRPLFVYYGTELSYADIDELSDRFAGYLRAAGVGIGDRVAVMLPNCPQFAIAFYGILKAGAVHVPVNPMFRDEEAAFELADTAAELILVWDALLPLVGRIRARTALRHVVATTPAEYVAADSPVPVPSMLGRQGTATGADGSWADVLRTEPIDAWAEQDLDALASLNYTGGTTGMPKGCEHSQRHMIYTAATASSMRPASRRPEGDVGVGLCFVPVFWIAGEDAALIISVFTGSTCVLLSRWDPEAVLRSIDRYRVTSMAATVDNYLQLLDHPSFTDHDLSSVQAPGAMSFVTKLNPQIRARWRAATGGVLCEGSYGMTETHTIDSFVSGFQDGDVDLTSRPVFCGIPMPGTQFKIVDFDSGDLRPIGEEGEICVRSPSVLTGYWRRPDATAEALRDGWLHTGDIGLLDERGCLHFLGRRKEMLKVNGMSVFPSEVEVLLGAHPDVAGSGVVGVADPQRGQVPLAFVQLTPGARDRVDEESIVAWCREHMATYKVPRVRFVDQLPLTATGKVKKHELAALV